MILSLSDKTTFIRQHIMSLGEWMDIPTLGDYLSELETQDELKLSIEKAVATVELFKTKEWDGILRIAGLYRAALYTLIRALGAHHVVETGVLHGLSSVFSLQALKKNEGEGKMISIDYPSTFEDGPVNLDGYTDTLPPGLGSGWIIDESFHDQWDLRLGSSLDLLDKAVGAPGRLDMFIHDSDHTYETMWFEFETAWPSLREGGILLADNVETNTSFFDFCRKVNRIPYILPADPDHLQPLESGIRVGLIIK